MYHLEKDFVSSLNNTNGLASLMIDILLIALANRIYIFGYLSTWFPIKINPSINKAKGYMFRFNIKIITSNNFGSLKFVYLKYFLATDKNTQKVFPINTKYLSCQSV